MKFKDIFIVMGVCGCGKSQVGTLLAERLGLPFIEGDEFHPAANRARMSAGIPLQDDDRWAWLDILSGMLAEHVARGTGAVLACSSLKRRYRDRLRRGAPGACFIHLTGDAAVIEARLKARQGHFMAPSLLASQMADLEPLTADERHLLCPVDQTLDQQVAGLLAQLQPAE